MEQLKLPKINTKVPHPRCKHIKEPIPILPTINSGSSTTSSLSSWSHVSLNLASSTSSQSAFYGATRPIASKISQSTTIKTATKEKQRRNVSKKTETGGRKEVRSSIDDQMNYNHLRRLERIFKEGDREGKGLDLNQFRIAMKKTVGSDVDDHELEMLFMKVDTNCDGTLDWGEYLSYMLLEYQEKKNMFSLDQDCPFPIDLSLKANCHLDAICSIRLLQAYTTRYNVHGLSEPDDGASRWLTLSRDGVLNIWNLDWVNQKSFPLDGAKGSASNPSGGLSVTDMVCMPNCSTIAVASTSYEVSFYTLMSNMMQKRFQIRDLRYCALTMDYSYNVQDPRNAILVWGDTSGSLVVIRFYVNPNLSLFSAPMCTNNKISLARLICGKLPGLQATKFRNVHTDWIRQVQYYKNSKGQESLISCCIKAETALMFADITEKSSGNQEQKPQIIKKSHFVIRKGVLCHSYDPEWNLIATGSRDCDVRVWNPYVVDKSMVVLKGHTYAVLQVHMRLLDHQVISISKDKNVRIWDLRDYTCKQNIHGRNVDLGRCEITSACFSNRHKELILATTKIGVFHPRNPVVARHKQQQYRSHQKPVVTVLYNPVFKQIVTGGEDSTICLWDMQTGIKKMQFFTGYDHDITCMAFDPTHRRLLTGGRNGDVILWNFNNGERLKSYEKLHDQEIANVMFARDRIVATSWKGHVCTHLDTYGKDRSEKLNQRHNDDILSLDFHKQDSILATSSFDGDIFIWSIDTGCVIMTFNMHHSLLPIYRLSDKPNSNTKRSFTRKRATYDPIKLEAEIKNRFNDTLNHAHERRRAGLLPDDINVGAKYWLPPEMPWLMQQDNKINEDIQENSSHSSSETNESSSLTSISSIETTSHDLTDRATYKVMFLQTRSCEQGVGSLIAAGCEGWLSIWSIHKNGGMLGYFKACNKKTTNSVFIASMATDCYEKILVTGDSEGYIRVWNISDYCKGEQQMTNECDETNSDTDQAHILPKDEPPDLQTSVRAHISGITSLTYIDSYGLIVSGGNDGSVRMWTSSGRYIGNFGQHDSWNITIPEQMQDLPTLIPFDVQRVASLNTLCTSKGTSRNRWDIVKTIHTAVSALTKKEKKKHDKHFESQPSSVSELGRSNGASIEEQLMAVESTLLDESSLLTNRKARIKRESVTIWLQDKPHSIVCLRSPETNVNNTYRNLQEGMKSNILGKVNYKPKRRHRRPKKDPEIRFHNKHAVVFGSLPFVEVYSPSIPKVPDVIQNNLAMQPANAPHTLSKKLTFSTLPTRRSSIYNRKHRQSVISKVTKDAKA